MKILDYILKRLQEQSTYKGAIFVIAASGISVDPEKANAIAAAAMALVGVINIFRKEKK
jgi:hypothetical protein